MSLNNYTLDRFEGDYGVFIKRPNETDQILIPRAEFGVELKEGDIVSIENNNESYFITQLIEETAKQKSNIQNMMENLRRNK